MVDRETYEELKEHLENTKMAIRSGRPRFALSHLSPLLDGLFHEVFDAEDEPVATAEPEDESELTVEELVEDNTRDQLNKIAAEAGIEDADDLANKSDVAKAIVAARN